jgi:hypothetical protein
MNASAKKIPEKSSTRKYEPGKVRLPDKKAVSSAAASFITEERRKSPITTDEEPATALEPANIEVAQYYNYELNRPYTSAEINSINKSEYDPDKEYTKRVNYPNKGWGIYDGEFYGGKKRSRKSRSTRRKRARSVRSKRSKRTKRSSRRYRGRKSR